MFINLRLTSTEPHCFRAEAFTEYGQLMMEVNVELKHQPYEHAEPQHFFQISPNFNARSLPMLLQAKILEQIAIFADETGFALLDQGIHGTFKKVSV